MAKKPLFVKLIIFDLDGTLLDSKKDIVVAVNETLKHLGLPKKSEKLVTSYIGWGSNKLLVDALGPGNQRFLDEAVSFYWKYYSRHELDNTKVCRGAKGILEHFKSKTMAVISNKQRVFVMRQLKALGISRYFKQVLGGDDAKCAKPSPCPVNDMMKKFKAKKEETIIVGDMSLDIETGKAAGIHTCAVLGGIGDKGELLSAKPDFVISKLIQLKTVIE